MHFVQTDGSGAARESIPRSERPSGLRDTAIRARILVVDDDLSGGRGLEALLSADGFSTATAAHGEEALAEARRELPDLILTDLHMPTMGGVELCNRIHEMDPELPVIVMTAFADMASAVESLRAGAEDYLIKPL
jgi:CheY-like chemotaxis protein